MLNNLIDFIELHNCINDKNKLTELVSDKFQCVKDKSVFYTKYFAIRFCKGQGTSQSISNTVLSLSELQKYDDRPFIVCICSIDKNYLLLANTTFLSKISHSSQALRTDNIKGSFNAPDIMREWGGIANLPENFDNLFAFHQNFTFEENLSRLVEATNNIVPTGTKFDVTVTDRLNNIMQSPVRALNFSASPDYSDLLADLDGRTNAYKNEILIAACIENVNLRGKIIEYIIAGEDIALRESLIQAITFKSELPRLVTRDGLGDYTKNFYEYHTETDIKTKIMILSSAPKGYNIDKLLEFLSEPNSVFMIYFVGIDFANNNIKTKLVSMFQNMLIDNTIIQGHWAGRNSRGASQFNGNAVKQIIINGVNTISLEKSKHFLEKILVL